MTIAAKRRFDPAHVFRPQSVSLSGSGTALGRKISTHLTAQNFSGTLDLTGQADQVDLALIADDAPDVEAAVARFAARNARAALVLSDAPDLADLARPIGLRVLGPHSFGLVLPALGLNASLFALPPPRGRVALVGQSASIARTVIDWAVPNGVGFSHLIGIGGNADIGFGLVLDHLSRDPGTAAIMLDVARLRNPKQFLAAARAAARLRPVVAIAPGMISRDPKGGFAPALEAALSRAGVLLTGSIGEFLAAAETLTRVKPARGEALAIVTNSVAVGRLAADSALAAGLELAEFSDATTQLLSLCLGHAPPPGPIHAAAAPTKLAEIATTLSTRPEIGGILVIHTPSGEDDDATIEALIACAKTIKVPLLITAMGEANGLKHRHRLSQARLACFDAPERAVAGFRHLLRNRRNRAAARELPPSTIVQLAPDRDEVARRLAAARAGGSKILVQDEALGLVAAYGIPVLASRHVETPEQAAAAAARLGFPAVLKLSHPDIPTNQLAGSVALDLPDEKSVLAAAEAILVRLRQEGRQTDKAGFVVQNQAPRGTMLRIRVGDHPVLGPVIGLGAGGGDPDEISALAADLPPLNLALARALIQRSPIAGALAPHRGQPGADLHAIAAMLVRVSQLIVDTPEILVLDLDPIFAHAQGAIAASARILLRPPGNARPALIISPYPSEFVTQHEAKGQKFTIRPIRPEDADAQAAMFARFTEDDMRFRFFAPLRNLPPEQIVRMSDIDYAREMVMLAMREPDGSAAGAAQLVRNDTDGRTAEFAVAVEPSAKGLGLGTALMRAIIDWGRAQGIAEINGQILADNAPMLAFIQRLGFKISRIPDEPDLVDAKLPLP